MIINHRYKFIYIGMTKTASESLHSFFNSMNRSINPQTVRGKIKNFRHHGRIPPPGLNEYYSIVSVRNPYDRLVSIHAMSKRLIKRNTNLGIPTRSLDDLLDYFLKIPNIIEDKDDITYDYRWLPIHKFIKPIVNIKYFLRFEYLKDDINQLPFNTKLVLPHKNINTNYPSFKELATPEIIEKTNKWAGKDFELFNYKKYNNIGEINE